MLNQLKFVKETVYGVQGEMPLRDDACSTPIKVTKEFRCSIEVQDKVYYFTVEGELPANRKELIELAECLANAIKETNKEQ